MKTIAGVDEDGRGSLIGPVYAAAVIIEKKISRSKNDRRFFVRNDHLKKSKPEFSSGFKPKTSNDFHKRSTEINKNFEIRKKAEERATKRFRGLKEDELGPKKTNLSKSKNKTKTQKAKTKAKTKQNLQFAELFGQGS